jgi:hypothetical protein
MFPEHPVNTVLVVACQVWALLLLPVKKNSYDLHTWISNHVLLLEEVDNPVF